MIKIEATLGALLLALSMSAVAGAESNPLGEPKARPGELVEGVLAVSTATAPDTSVSKAGAERYAAYLPATHRSDRSWPVLIVMDPRGRAAVAAEIFRPAAERFGYVVLSSESTRSDLAAGTADPNEPALRALLRTADLEYNADPDRIYLAGFSGTSRFAWIAGKAFPDRIAGIVGVGGGLPGPWAEWSRVGFSYFGAVGRHDFNHREMRELDELLDGVLPHRFAFFEGGHRWLEPRHAEEALGWMELEAMRRGLTPKRPELVATLLTERLEAADRAERDDRPFDVFEALLAIAEDFNELVAGETLEPVRARAAALATDDRVTRGNNAVRDAVLEEKSYRETVGAAVRRIAYEASPPTAAELARSLRLPNLQRRTSGDSQAADSARRQLELAFVHLAFYTPQGLHAKEAPRRAALSLEVATMIFPDRPLPWLRLAEARTLAGQKRGAILALGEAVDRGFADAQYLRDHEDLAVLRTEENFHRIVARAEANSR